MLMAFLLGHEPFFYEFYGTLIFLDWVVYITYLFCECELPLSKLIMDKWMIYSYRVDCCRKRTIQIAG